MDIKICPKCKSEKLEIIREGKIPGKLHLYYGAQNWYRCAKCGFESLILPEVNIKAFKSKIKNRKWKKIKD